VDNDGVERDGNGDSVEEGMAKMIFGLQKPKGLGERKMERTYAGFFLRFF
jgi:hypothetical protein